MTRKLYVKEETVTTTTPAKYDAKELYATIDWLLFYPFLLSVFSVIAFGICVATSHFWFALFAGILMVAFGFSFHKGVKVWTANGSGVTSTKKRYYVEFPEARRGR